MYITRYAVRAIFPGIFTNAERKEAQKRTEKMAQALTPDMEGNLETIRALVGVDEHLIHPTSKKFYVGFFRETFENIETADGRANSLVSMKPCLDPVRIQDPQGFLDTLSDNYFTPGIITQIALNGFTYDAYCAVEIIADTLQRNIVAPLINEQLDGRNVLQEIKLKELRTFLCERILHKGRIKGSSPKRFVSLLDTRCKEFVDSWNAAPPHKEAKFILTRTVGNATKNAADIKGFIQNNDIVKNMENIDGESCVPFIFADKETMTEDELCLLVTLSAITEEARRCLLSDKEGKSLFAQKYQYDTATFKNGAVMHSIEATPKNLALMQGDEGSDRDAQDVIKAAFSLKKKKAMGCQKDKDKNIDVLVVGEPYMLNIITSDKRDIFKRGMIKKIGEKATDEVQFISKLHFILNPAIYQDEHKGKKAPYNAMSQRAVFYTRKHYQRSPYRKEALFCAMQILNTLCTAKIEDASLDRFGYEKKNDTQSYLVLDIIENAIRAAGSAIKIDKENGLIIEAFNPKVADELAR